MKFSIVSPTFNSGKYISETIDSVLSQEGDFEIEYIIIDNCSTDNTPNIIRNYEEGISKGGVETKCREVTFKWLSEKDEGMYGAINKGFELATGDIFAWINADDTYLPGAFDIVHKTFKKYSEIQWLKGITSYIDEASNVIRKGKCYLYDREWIKKGVYGLSAYFIQQDSVFWRAALWRKSGGIDSTLKLAGDLDLWLKLADYTSLYSVKANISCFRKNRGQLSEDSVAYKEECEKIVRLDKRTDKKIKLYFKLERIIPNSILKKAVYSFFFGTRDFMLIDLVNDNNPVLKKVHYYLG